MLVKMNVEDIIIPESFSAHPPRKEKILATVEYIKKNKRLEKAISVNSKNVLTDGFKQYCAAKLLKVKVVPVIVPDPKPEDQRKSQDKRKGGREAPRAKTPVVLPPEMARQIDIEEIIVPGNYLNTHAPKESDIEVYTQYIKDHGCTMKPVIIWPSGTIYDGYKQYLAAQRAGLTEVTVGVRNYAAADLLDLDAEGIPFAIPYDSGRGPEHVRCVFEGRKGVYIWTNEKGFDIHPGDRLLVHNLGPGSTAEVIAIDTFRSPYERNHKEVLEVLGPAESEGETEI